MAGQVPVDVSSTLTLNDGVVMPLFGLGTYQIPTSQCERLLCVAVQNGYRMFDTATFYGNEAGVGQAVKSCGLPRSEVFVVTKLWDDSHGYDNCKAAFKESFDKLDIGYVDLYLMHSPLGGQILRTYDAMLELKAEGKIKSVGVSNFGVQHLEGLREAGRPMPSANQIELHPMMRKEDVVAYCLKNGIAVMGYSPLAKAQRMHDKLLSTMAQKYSKSVAQLMIRWSVQHGYITIPKTSKPERVVENAQVFDWNISDDDMNVLNTLPIKGCTWDPTTSEWHNLA